RRGRTRQDLRGARCAFLVPGVAAVGAIPPSRSGRLDPGAVVGGDEVGEIGLMIAATLVVPVDVGSQRVAACSTLGRRAGAREFAVHDAFEDDLAVVREDR